ncbi:MAG: Zn-dependent exopeptidase M28 [Chloroflexi bacterium]|nr:Zn-dependent exopeptidase M28 [Chloroflexota bacterium]
MVSTHAAASASEIASRIEAHLGALADRAPRRPPGSAANRAATQYVEGVLRAAGVPTEALPFTAHSWQPGAAWLELDGRAIPIEPPPFCGSATVRGPAVPLAAPGELNAFAAGPGAVILLRDELAVAPYFPKAFPFVSFPEQVEVIAALEAVAPAAVLAVVDAARAGEPTFEDPDLAFPYATIPASLGDSIAPGAEVGLRVEASIEEGEGVNLSGGTLTGRRAIVCAHVDSKATTPGLLDNGGGVAVLLALAESGFAELGPTELVFFNGEDHYAAPGEQTWLAARDLAEIELVVNIDGAGLAGHRAAASTLAGSSALEERVAQIVARCPGLEIGPPWFESDHAVFAMRGIPTVAITSAGDVEVLKRLAHAADETLARVDPRVLADVARFVQLLLGQPARATRSA